MIQGVDRYQRGTDDRLGADLPPGAQGEPERPARGDAEYAHLAPLLAGYAESRSTDRSSRELRDRLVAGYLPVALHVARRYHGRGEPLDDLEQVATIGLLKAIERFQPDFGAPFLAYAIPTITGEIRRHFRDLTWSMRVPRRLKDLHVAINRSVVELSQVLNRSPRPTDIAARLGISVEEVLEGLEAAHSYHVGSLDQPLSTGEKGSVLADVVGADDRALDNFVSCGALAPHIAGLPERERAILVMRFYDDMTQSQIAERAGISQMHVSRLLTKVLAYLRDAVDEDLPPLSGREHPLMLQPSAARLEPPADTQAPSGTAHPRSRREHPRGRGADRGRVRGPDRPDCSATPANGRRQFA